MRSLPRPARLYVVLIYITGLSVLATAAQYRGAGALGHLRPSWELAFFLVLAVLAGSKKVQLIPGEKYDQVGSMSLGFAVTFLALLRFGPVAGVVVSILSTGIGCYSTRQPAYQLGFNVALSAAATWTAGMVLVRLGPAPVRPEQMVSLLAVAAATVAYFLVNTGGVTGVISLCTGKPVASLWRKTFLWTAPSYFAAASISTLALLMFGNTLNAVVLFGAPVAYLVYQSYAVYVDRELKKQKHIAELQHSQAQLADLYLATIKSLALAIDAKDQYTHQHILRVQRYALAIAEQMGLTGADLDGLRTGALLHDIGKLGVPEYVLLKPGRLTPDEFAKIRKHPEIGAAILDPVEFPWPVLPVVKYHHERWDGTGYPEGLKGEEIPLTARVLAVADVYDAMTSTRAYRHAMTHEETIETIRAEAGTHFDPAVVQAFLAVVEGIVDEMAAEGHGPKAMKPAASKPITSKADEAARDIRHASSELSALYEVAQTIACSFGLDETLEILARKLQAILPGATSLFLLHDKAAGGLSVRAAVGVNREFFQGGRTLSATSASIQAMQRRESIVGDYDPDDLMLTASQMTPWTPLRSALIVPIVHENEVLGTINLYHPDADAFSAHDRQLMQTIAERVAMALYNGLLYDRTHGQAYTDPLTGLYNLRYLTQYVDERCRQAMRQQAGEAAGGAADGRAVVGRVPAAGQAAGAGGADRFGLLCMGLDSFRAINDIFGHQKGDEVLADVSRLIRAEVRDADIVARYSGDEFLVVLQGVGAAEAEKMAARLHDAIEQYDAGLSHPRLGALRLSAGVGCACYPRDGADSTTLLSTATARMHAVKSERKLVQLVDRPRLEVAGSESESGDAAVIYIKEVNH